MAALCRWPEKHDLNVARTRLLQPERGALKPSLLTKSQTERAIIGPETRFHLAQENRASFGQRENVDLRKRSFKPPRKNQITPTPKPLTRGLFGEFTLRKTG